MKRKTNRELYAAGAMLIAFVLWTVLVRLVDVRAIGPKGSYVGFATLNGMVHALTGVNWSLYVITDWLGLVPILVVLGFAILGLLQWIKRKSLAKVDRSLLLLGGFYVIVVAVFMTFETLVINYRPMLIEGVLEASYPSSTTMLVMCVMPTALMQFYERIKKEALKRCVAVILLAFTAFMIIGRLLSGVHWVTDIIGGALFSTGLVMTYDWCIHKKS